MCLRHQTGRAHAHKAQAEIEEVEYKAAQGHTANKGRIAQPAHHRRICRPNQGNGDIGQKNWP